MRHAHCPVKRGLTLGKYAPLHRGHQSVIETGLAEMDEMTLHLHGGDVTLRAWTGQERSLWVHCTGGITGERNDDWTVHQR